MNDVCEAADTTRSTLLVALDMSAFETIDHSSLINRHSFTFGINDTPLQCVTSIVDKRSSLHHLSRKLWPRQLQLASRCVCQKVRHSDRYYLNYTSHPLPVRLRLMRSIITKMRMIRTYSYRWTNEICQPEQASSSYAPRLSKHNVFALNAPVGGNSVRCRSKEKGKRQPQIDHCCGADIPLSPTLTSLGAYN